MNLVGFPIVFRGKSMKMPFLDGILWIPDGNFDRKRRTRLKKVEIYDFHPEK